MTATRARALLVCGFAVVVIGIMIDDAGPVAAAPQGWTQSVLANRLPERVIGLLNVPEVRGDGCGPEKPQTANLYQSPSADNGPIGTITLHVTGRLPDGSSCDSVTIVVHRPGGADEELPTEETDYEVQAAVVYEHSGPWFRIGLQRGSAWIKREDAGDFKSYPEVLIDKLAYVKRGWNGTLWRTPGAGPAAHIPSGWTRYLNRDVEVDVLAVRTVRAEPWIQIRLVTERCGEPLTGVVTAIGWIRAYKPSGENSAWFASRGC
jgi:hypothetical protein